MKCDDKNIKWLKEMTGKEFAQFILIPDNRGRKFITLSNDICKEADVIIIEATEAQYREWYSEHMHHEYLSKTNKVYETVSIDFPIDGGDLTLNELIADLDVDVENTAIDEINLEIIRLAMRELCKKQLDTVITLFFKYPYETEEAISKLISIKRNTLSMRKLASINKLRFLAKKTLAKSRFFQQQGIERKKNLPTNFEN